MLKITIIQERSRQELEISNKNTSHSTISLHQFDSLDNREAIAMSRELPWL
jgi:hypothetical protein